MSCQLEQCDIAKQLSCQVLPIWSQVSLDTASFEVVTNCWASLLHLLQQGLVDILLCNEDEALAVAKVLCW